MKILRTQRINNLNESGNEGKTGDTFSHDGNEFDLNKVKAAVKNNPVRTLQVADLKWVLEYADVDTERLKTADIDNPVIATYREGEWVVLDGAHRLTVAVKEKVKELPAKVISKADLMDCKIKE